MCGMSDVHLLTDSWTVFTCLCRRKASVKVTTYPTIVEMQSAVSAADQARIIVAPAGGRRAIASKAISTGVKSISCIPSSLILSSNFGSRMNECCLRKVEISNSAWYSSSLRWYNADSLIWMIEPVGTVIHRVWLGRIMRVAMPCWLYVRVAVRVGVLTSHRLLMISACVTVPQLENVVSLWRGN